jgi:uncharacterized RDD family membrane protein YckC
VREPAVPDEAILTLDNVTLELPVAGVGSRALAAFLDYLIVSVVLIVWFLVSAMAAGALAVAGVGPGWGIALVILGAFALEHGYFAGVEAITGGRTPGKRALGLRVVARHGGQPGTPALLLRNALRLVDLLVGVPMMALDPLSRRVGDHLAGTIVIHARRPDADLVLERVPAGWTGREVAVLENFLRRAGHMERSQAERLAQRLVALVDRDDPSFLAGVDRADGPERTLRRATGLGG